MGICQLLQKANVNFTGGVSTLPTDPEKGRADKQTTINVDCMSDVLTVDRNMHERMNPDEP